MTEIDKEVVRLIKEYKIEPSKQLFTEDSLNNEILEWFENIKLDLIDFIASSLTLKGKHKKLFVKWKMYLEKTSNNTYLINETEYLENELVTVYKKIMDA